MNNSSPVIWSETHLDTPSFFISSRTITAFTYFETHVTTSISPRESFHLQDYSFYLDIWTTKDRLSSAKSCIISMYSFINIVYMTSEHSTFHISSTCTGYLILTRTSTLYEATVYRLVCWGYSLKDMCLSQDDSPMLGRHRKRLRYTDSVNCSFSRCLPSMGASSWASQKGYC